MPELQTIIPDGGDILTRVAGVLDNITRANLAADTAFTGSFIKAGVQSNPSLFNTVIGTGGMPNPPADTYAGLTASISVNNPDKIFMGGLSGWAYYSGTEQAGCGSIQGGACDTFAAMTGIISQPVLSWEMIASGHSSGTYAEVTAGQATAFVEDTCTVTELTALKIRAPFSNGGTPTVTNAYSFRVQEPLVGTNKFSAFIAGRTRLIKGTPTNALEISNASNLLQWASNGTRITGYASNGTSERVILNPEDGADYARIISYTQGAGRHFACVDNDVPVFEVASNGNLVFGDGANIGTGTTTGTKIGVSTTQKIGFYNATPVVQGASVADATDAASAITQLNALISRIEATGLIATV